MNAAPLAISDLAQRVPPVVRASRLADLRREAQTCRAAAIRAELDGAINKDDNAAAAYRDNAFGCHLQARHLGGWA